MAMTAAEKKRRQSAKAEATRITQKEQQPYITAADAAKADADRIMTAEQIAAQYGGGKYDNAMATAGMLAPTTAINAANAMSMLSGLVGALPGAGSYDTTSLLAGFADSNAANARLGSMYAGSLGTDIVRSRDVGIATAQGRADERRDRLSSEERELRLKGDIAGSNYLTNLSNILNIRGQRQNLALSKFQLEQAKREAERRGRGGSNTIPDEDNIDTEQEEIDYKKIRDKGAVQSAYGLEGLIGGYQPAFMGSSRPAPRRRY